MNAVIRWVVLWVVLVILGAFFQALGVRLGFYGNALLFAIVYYFVFVQGAKKDKERVDTISTGVSKSEEVVSLEEEIKDIDKSI